MDIIKTVRSRNAQSKNQQNHRPFLEELRDKSYQIPTEVLFSSSALAISNHSRFSYYIYDCVIIIDTSLQSMIYHLGKVCGRSRDYTSIITYPSKLVDECSSFASGSCRRRTSIRSPELQLISVATCQDVVLYAQQDHSSATVLDLSEVPSEPVIGFDFHSQMWQLVFKLQYLLLNTPIASRVESAIGDKCIDDNKYNKTTTFC